MKSGLVSVFLGLGIVAFAQEHTTHEVFSKYGVTGSFVLSSSDNKERLHYQNTKANLLTSSHQNEFAVLKKYYKEHAKALIGSSNSLLYTTSAKKKNEKVFGFYTYIKGFSKYKKHIKTLDTNNDRRISKAEQLAFLKTLGFKEAALQDALLRLQNSVEQEKHLLFTPVQRYRWQMDSTRDKEWFSGIIKHKKKLYFFRTDVVLKQKNNEDTAQKISAELLYKKGFLPLNVKAALMQ